MSQQLKNLYDKVLTEQYDGKEAPVTLASICCSALMGEVSAETTGKEKVRRYNLATSIVGKGAVNVTAEDVALLKDLVGKMFTTLCVGQAMEMLDPSEE